MRCFSILSLVVFPAGCGHFSSPEAKQGSPPTSAADPTTSASQAVQKPANDLADAAKAAVKSSGLDELRADLAKLDQNVKDLKASREATAKLKQDIQAQRQKNAALAKLTVDFDVRIAVLNRRHEQEFAPVMEELKKLYQAASVASPEDQVRLRPRIRELEARLQKIIVELDSAWAQLGMEMNEAQKLVPARGQSLQKQPQHSVQTPPTAPRAAERQRLLANIERQKVQVEESFQAAIGAEYDRLQARMDDLRADSDFGDLFSEHGRAIAGQVFQSIPRQIAELKKGASGDSQPARNRKQSLAELEQERRRILARYPLPGDPKYVELNGTLVTEAEAAEQKVIEAERKAIRKANAAKREADRKAKEARAAAIEAAKWRTWTGASGEHKIEAKYGGRIGDNVKLINRDGTAITVSLDKLSDVHKDWINARRK